MMTQFNEWIGSIIWGPPMLAAFLGVGLLFSVRSGFFQLRHIRLWFRETLVATFRRKDVRSSRDGKSISQFQALSAALAACMGTGNIVGVATAICAGGPGTIFWMWLSALLGMMTSCAENILGIRYRYRDKNGEWMGGAMVYLERGLNLKKTAKAFSLFLVLASFGIGNMTQGNSIAQAMDSAFGISPAIVGLVVAVLLALVVLGGIQRIAAVAEAIIPLMSIIFIGASFYVIGVNYTAIPDVLRMIVREAFAPSAAAGGFLGYGISKAMRFGIARGVFSNEAGLGSSAIIHAAADVDQPATQGMWGILEVFLDTVLMCTVTALTILCSGIWTPDTPLNGAHLSAAAFSSAMGESGKIFVSLSVTIFAFATLIGWSYYGKRGAQYLLGERAAFWYLLLYILAAFFGCIAKLEAVWAISDIFNGLMAIPNLLALALLSGEATRELRRGTRALTQLQPPKRSRPFRSRSS